MLHPLPKDLQITDLLAAFKNAKTDPWEGAHAGWHAVGYGIQLFHANHEGFKAAAANNPAIAAKLADIEATMPFSADTTEEGFKAISWDQIKPWLKKVAELLLMILD